MSSVPLMQYPDFSLKNRVAIVTGASRGIGYGLVKALAHAGATVVAAARDEQGLRSVVEEVTQEGGRAYAKALDVRDVASLEPFMAEVKREHGAVDVLVNNAGLGFNHAALDVTEQDWEEMMAVNAKGAFFACQAAALIMLKQGAGRIINMSSQASVVGIKDHAVYCASKGALNQLTRVLALEWGKRGVTVNAIGPTFIRTPGTAERLDDPQYLEGVLARIPLKQVGSITDVAAAVIYLASPAGRLVNGSLLLVDGGWTAQ